MRKISLILVIVLFAAPVWAEVQIECSIDGTEVTISYLVTETEPNLVRAFALDISVTGANIVDVNDDVSAVDDFDGYTIYPGSIVIVDGVVTDDGSPVADPNDPGSISGPNAVTIEMGALYSPTNDGSPNAPPPQSNTTSYELLKLICDGIPVSVSISENDARGGVVMTDPTLNPDVVAPGCVGGPPACWSFLTQCWGDSDDTGDVKVSDFLLLKDSWYKTYPDDLYEACADFNRDGEVKVADFLILKDHWYKTVDPNCATGGTWPPE